MWALTEDGFIYAVVFDEDLAHELANEYDFDIEEMHEGVPFDTNEVLN